MQHILLGALNLGIGELTLFKSPWKVTAFRRVSCASQDYSCSDPHELSAPVWDHSSSLGKPPHGLIMRWVFHVFPDIWIRRQQSNLFKEGHKQQGLVKAWIPILIIDVSYSKNETRKPEDAWTGMCCVSSLYMNQSETNMCEHDWTRPFQQLGKECV